MALRSTKALHYYHKQRPLRANFFRNNFHRSEEVRNAEIGAREMIDNHGSQEQQHNSEFTYFMRRTSNYYSHFPWVSACVFVVGALKMAFMMRPEIIPSLPFFFQPSAHKEYGIRNGAQSPISSGGMMNWDDEIGDSAAGEVSSKSGNHAAYSKMSIERCVLRFDRFDAAKERRTDILNGVDNEVEAMRKIAA